MKFTITGFNKVRVDVDAKKFKYHGNNDVVFLDEEDNEIAYFSHVTSVVQKDSEKVGQING